MAGCRGSVRQTRCSSDHASRSQSNRAGNYRERRDGKPDESEPAAWSARETAVLPRSHSHINGGGLQSLTQGGRQPESDMDPIENWLHGKVEERPPQELAARYSFVVPLAAIAVGFVLLETGYLVFREPEAIVSRHSLAVCLLCVMPSSALMGLVSMCGVSRSTWKPIVWRAVIGIITSFLIGFIAFCQLAFERFKQ